MILLRYAVISFFFDDAIDALFAADAVVTPCHAFRFRHFLIFT